MLCSKKPNELYPIPCVSHWVLKINTLSVKFLPEVSKVYVVHGFELGVYGTNYILLHYATLHYILLHYTTLHYTTLHTTTLHYTTYYYTMLRYATLHYILLHYTTLHYTTLHYTTWFRRYGIPVSRVRAHDF